MTNPLPLQLSTLTDKELPFIKKFDREQEDLLNKLFKTKRVLVDAIAGSGKTTVLTQGMLALKRKGHINKIYYVVFPVQEGSLGFLPGDLSKKIREYAVPFRQALIKAGVNPLEIDLDRMCDEEEEGDYKVVPHTFLRGRTLENVGIISDETQNGTLDELQKTFTRIEDSCYLAIAGHTGQIDIPKDQSGFAPYIHHFKRGVQSGVYKGIAFAELTTNHRGEFSSYADQIRKYALPTGEEQNEYKAMWEALQVRLIEEQGASGTYIESRVVADLLSLMGQLEEETKGETVV